MLGVHGIVLHGGVQPEAVALFAVVEGALERTRRPGAATRTSTAAPGRALGFLLVLGLGGGGSNSGCGLLFRGLARGLFGGTRLFFGLARGFGFELGGDLRVVFRAQVHLFGGGAVLFEVGLEALLALEGLDLLDGDFQLVRNPRIGATLSHPPADLVKLRTQGPAAHRRAGD